MNPDPEDDALSWDGDDALEARRPAPRRERQSPPPAASSTEPSDTAADGASDVAAAAASAAEAEATEPEGIGTVALVLLGILGGVYLLYTIGWILGGVGMQTKALFMLPAPLYQASMWLAALAPALWFTAALLMTRHSKDWVRVVALVVGALLLVPWPFVVAGGGGVL